MEPILLIAHGTREPRGNAEAAAVARDLERTAGRPVHLAFLEHAEPSIPRAIDDLHAAGARAMDVLPMILTAAGHVKNDIPASLDRAAARHPGMTFRVAGHLGVHAFLLDVLADRRRAAREGTDPAGTEALVVVGRGAADPDANAEIYKLARLLWEAAPCAYVGVGFMGVTTPTAQDALREAARAVAGRGPARIVVLPYFLFQGLLLERLDRVAAEEALAGPVRSIRVAHPIGPDPRLAATLAFRLRELADGTGRLNCGTCIYRLPMQGRADEAGGERAWERSLSKTHLGGPG